MENKEKEKKNHENDKPHHPQAPLKDLKAREEEANKVQGGTITYGPES